MKIARGGGEPSGWSGCHRHIKDDHGFPLIKHVELTSRRPASQPAFTIPLWSHNDPIWTAQRAAIGSVPGEVGGVCAGFCL